MLRPQHTALNLNGLALQFLGLRVVTFMLKGNRKVANGRRL
jgi:hypothetical protein